MIQIYKASNTDYTHNGDMTLWPTSCTVSAKLNGKWELTMEHPLDAEGRWKVLEEGAVLVVPSFNGSQKIPDLSQNPEQRRSDCIRTASIFGRAE